jgi:hypothetical protein
MYDDREVQEQTYYSHHIISTRNMKTGKRGIETSACDVVLPTVYDNITVYNREIIAEKAGKIYKFPIKKGRVITENNNK